MTIIQHGTLVLPDGLMPVSYTHLMRTRAGGEGSQVPAGRMVSGFSGPR